MKKALVLLVALFICGVAFSQENEKKFTLSIQENLLPFADADYSYDRFDDPNRVPCNLFLLNWSPTLELDYDNKFFARLRFNVLYADEGEGRYLTIACDKVRRQIQFAVDFLYLHR